MVVRLTAIWQFAHHCLQRVSGPSRCLSSSDMISPRWQSDAEIRFIHVAYCYFPQSRTRPILSVSDRAKIERELHVEVSNSVFSCSFYNGHYMVPLKPPLIPRHRPKDGAYSAKWELLVRQIHQIRTPVHFLVMRPTEYVQVVRSYSANRGVTFWATWFHFDILRSPNKYKLFFLMETFGPQNFDDAHRSSNWFASWSRPRAHYQISTFIWVYSHANSSVSFELTSECYHVQCYVFNSIPQESTSWRD